MHYRMLASLFSSSKCQQFLLSVIASTKAFQLFYHSFLEEREALQAPIFTITLGCFFPLTLKWTITVAVKSYLTRSPFPPLSKTLYTSLPETGSKLFPPLFSGFLKHHTVKMSRPKNQFFPGCLNSSYSLIGWCPQIDASFVCLFRIIKLKRADSKVLTIHLRVRGVNQIDQGGIV